MEAQDLVRDLEAMREFFNRSTSCFREEHSGFRPVEGMFTAAQQVAHVAQDFDWFLEGAFRPEGFELNLEGQIEMVRRVQSLQTARTWFERSVETFIGKIGSLSADELVEPLPPGPVLGGAPRKAIVGAVIDHTAHHRGALTVYARLLGLTPAIPYL